MRRDVLIRKKQAQLGGMMSYSDEWRALSARLKGLERVAQIYLQCNNLDTKGTDRRTRFLFDTCNSIYSKLRKFCDTNSKILPDYAYSFLESFLKNANAELLETKGSRPNVYESLMRLVALDAELTYLLSDTQDQIRSRSELAFIHLQNLISVDTETAGKWRDAYDHHETACEKLGKVQLLQHGILAFKADGGEHGRTDLIYNESPHEREIGAVIGIVHTEWKRAKPDAKSSQAFAEAREQAKLYQMGPIAGVELAGICYIIVVSQGRVTVPPDIDEGFGICYRHINIAVAPNNISEDAKRIARSI